MGMDIDVEDVRSFLEDNELMDGVVARVLKNRETLDDLAEDVADVLEDTFESDPTFRQKIIAGAMSDENFREKVTRALVSELS